MKKRQYTVFKRSYFAHTETAFLKVHDLSIVPELAAAFYQHTGYRKNGGCMNAYWFQFLEIRCSKHPTFAENLQEIREILKIFKSKRKPTMNEICIEVRENGTLSIQAGGIDAKKEQTADILQKAVDAIKTQHPVVALKNELVYNTGKPA